MASLTGSNVMSDRTCDMVVADPSEWPGWLLDGEEIPHPAQTGAVGNDKSDPPQVPERNNTMKMMIATALFFALASSAMAQSEDWGNQYNQTQTPSYGDIAYGIGSVWWGWIVGLNGGYSGSGNRCNCSVGGSDRVQ